VRSEAHKYLHFAEQVIIGFRLGKLINCLKIKLINDYTVIADYEVAIIGG
jgi:hypothetical protein